MSFKIAVVAGYFTFMGAFCAQADHHNLGACKDEIKKLCPNMKFGEGLGKCIDENKSKFSSECQEKMSVKKEERKERRHEFGKACKDDMKKLCKDVEKGEGRILKCLKEHESSLSPDCKEKMEKH